MRSADERIIRARSKTLNSCAAPMGSGCAKLAKLQSFWCIRHCAQLKGSVTENERASLTQLAEIQTLLAFTRSSGLLLVGWGCSYLVGLRVEDYIVRRTAIFHLRRHIGTADLALQVGSVRAARAAAAVETADVGS